MYEIASRLSAASLVQKKAGRRSLDKIPPQEKAGETIALHSQVVHSTRICAPIAKSVVDAYMTWSLPLFKMFYVPEKHDDDESFYRRMNYFTSANDSVENDVKYCL